MNAFDTPAPPGTDIGLLPLVAAETPPAVTAAPESHHVDPARSAAGRLGGQRVHTLVLLGREYEREHGLTAGRERLKQLVKLGKRYEVEHGLRAARPRRKRKADAWREFVSALALVVKPQYRQAVEQLVASLKPAEETFVERAA